MIRKLYHFDDSNYKFMMIMVIMNYHELSQCDLFTRKLLEFMLKAQILTHTMLKLCLILSQTANPKLTILQLSA